MFLVTTDRGNHEFGKVFYQNGKYNVRDGYAKLGGSTLVGCELDTQGATLRWSCGRISEIPRGWYQVTYRH